MNTQFSPEPVSPFREPATDAEGGPTVDDTSDWRDGRLVIRRPEARNSVMARCYIEQTPEEARILATTLAETVKRRRGLSDEERASQLDQLAALAAKANVAR